MFAVTEAAARAKAARAAEQHIFNIDAALMQHADHGFRKPFEYTVHAAKTENEHQVREIARLLQRRYQAAGWTVKLDEHGGLQALPGRAPAVLSFTAAALDP